MTRFKTLIGVSVCLALALWAATPPSGTVSEGNTPTWTGPFKTPTNSAVCNGPNDPACDNFLLTVVPPPPAFGPFVVEIVLQPAAAGDWDLQVFDSNNNVVGTSGEAPSVAETVTLSNPAAGTYTVAAAAFAPNIGPDVDGDGTLDSYSARAEIKAAPPPQPPGSEYFTYATYADPEGRGAAEPSVAANWLSGRTMYIAGLRTLRVTWDDCPSPPDVLWEDVTFPTTGVTSLDPILFTDPRTGRTFASQLSANCSTAAFTDDDGANWLPSQGCGANSGVDHQSIGGGRYHAPIPTPPPPLYPHAVYYCAQEVADATCSRSDDGGVTFGAAVPIYNLTQCGGLHGEPNVAPNDGAVYVPNRSCTGRQGVVVSEDNGLTWTIRRIPFTSPGDWDPDIGIGLDGTVYVGMTDGDGHPKIAVSTDLGASWSTPVDVGIPFDIDNTAFPVVIAGDGDRAAFAFLGIDADTGGGMGDDPNWPGGDPNTRPAWHLYVAHTYDRGVTWTTINATPNDPVQRGTIFGGGFTVDPPLTRNLLDFNRGAVDKFGRALIGWADGCIGSCVTGTTNSNTAIGTITRQVGGKRLFAQYDVLDVPAAPNVSAKTSAGPPPANIINWSEPDDHGSRITVYTVYRRTPTTTREVIATLGPAARSYTDSAIIAGQTYFYSVTATNAQGEGPFCHEVTPGVAPPPVHPCDYPGVTVLTDPSGDEDTMQPAHDALELSVTEPLSLGPGKIMFVLEMDALDSLTPDTYWPVQFNVGATTYTARMTTFPPATTTSPGFEYYQGAWNTLLPTVSPADAASNFNPDGTIQIIVPRSGVGNPAVGSNLTSFLVRISVNAGGVLVTPDNMPDSGAAAGSYQVYGSENCTEDGCPNPTFAGLQSVSAPPEETCTLDLAWDTATTSCPPQSYNIYRSTSSSFTPSTDNLIALGVDTLSYRDQAGLEFGTTYYYIVRAEDSQTSFDGPANHGREDDNMVRMSGSPSGSPNSAPDFSDDFEPTSEPGWTIDTAENANPASPAWAVTSDPFAHSASNSFFTAAGLDSKDDRLIAPPQNLSSSSILFFWQRFSLEPGYDGGVLELSTDGGSSWVDVEGGGGIFLLGGYNGTIDTAFGSPIAGREAWTGDSEFVDAMNEVRVYLGFFEGSNVLLRWRLVLDPFGAGATPGVGWWIDDVTLTDLVEPGPCVTPTCGNGIVDSGEECDDGVFNSDTEPDACRLNCTSPRCGDGVTDSGEGCDDGTANSDTEPNACRTDCQVAHCGDSVIDGGELCDNGAANSNTEPDACRTNCLPARCGDGTVDTGEGCDNGVANSDTEPDACRTYCQPASCGDGAVDTGEGCDNGASNSDTEPDACRTTCESPSCGDSVVDTGESCDDGGTVGGDGCSAVCEIELAAPAPDPSGVDKNRFLSFSVQPLSSAQAGPATALKVTMVDLQHPVPANVAASVTKNFTTFDTAMNGICSGGSHDGHHCDTAADCRVCAGGANMNGACAADGDCPGSFCPTSVCSDDARRPCSTATHCTFFGTCGAPITYACGNLAACSAEGEANGCARWVGKPSVFLEFQDVPALGSFVGARLQCTPYYGDFAAHGLFHVTGAEIVPSSSYEVVSLGPSCMGNEGSCLAVSPPLTIKTARYGDVNAPFSPPSTTTQPDATDVTQLVNKFKNVAGAPIKPIAQLHPNLPVLNGDVDASDIVQGVDSFKQFAYPFGGPCPCPSQAVCEALACPNGANDCVASGLPGLGQEATCIKTCRGGGNNGDSCLNNSHCPDGICDKECVAGTNAGLACNSSVDCPDPGGPNAACAVVVNTAFCRDRCGRCTP